MFCVPTVAPFVFVSSFFLFPLHLPPSYYLLPLVFISKAALCGLYLNFINFPFFYAGEVTVKWVEAIQTRLPMCVGGALFGALRLYPK
jgi:hypothetical protein